MINPPHMSYNHGAVNPADWDMIYRTAVVRLGGGNDFPGLYENNAHGSAGILSVTIDTDRNLVVTTDFDENTEKILSAFACIDLQLTAKGIFVGASGGGSVTKYALRSYKALTGGYAAGDQIRPNASCFDPLLDNIWITQVSMRPKA